MDPGFWKGKRVFVTGHTGFKGSWLTLWLKSLGANVVGYALNPPTEPNMYRTAGVARGIHSITADVRDQARLKREIKKARPEIIFHLAAQSVVRTSYEDPVGTYSTNIMGTVNVLESVRGQSGVRVVINVTSDKCYDNKEWVWGYRESDNLGGYDPYSNSKACSELITGAYRSSFFSTGPNKRMVGLATARAGNVIGGGDWTKDQLIPDIIRAMMQRRPVVLRNPRATRPWQFVLDALHGYLLLAEHVWEKPGEFSGAWNFGPGAEGVKTVEWITSRIMGSWKDTRGIQLQKGVQPHEANLLQLDSSKAFHFLGWRPLLSLEESLEWVNEWYKAYDRRDNVGPVSFAQLMAFQQRSLGNTLRKTR